MWTHTTCFAMMCVISVDLIEDHVLVCVINMMLVWMFVYTVWKRCGRIAFIHISKMMKSGRLWTRTTFLCIQCERVWFCVDMITLFTTTLPVNSFCVCVCDHIHVILLVEAPWQPSQSERGCTITLWYPLVELLWCILPRDYFCKHMWYSIRCCG